MRDQVHTIHNQLVNGNRQHMARLIDEYGNYDFWDDYRRYLFEVYVDDSSRYEYFSDACVSYNRIKNR